MTRDKKFLLGSVSFIFGVFFFPFIKINLWILFIIFGIASAFLFLFSKENMRILAIIILCFSFGLIRLNICKEMSDVENDLRKFDDKKITLECKIKTMPELKNGKQQITLEVQDDKFPHGKILAFMDAYGNYSYGDTVDFTGTLKIPENSGSFDYRKYLFQKNIYFISYFPKINKVVTSGNGFYSIIYNFRSRANDNIIQIMPSPEGNILSAMTLGINSDEIKNVMANYNKTGTSHIVVVSGSHLVIIIAIIMFIFLQAGINRKKIFYLVVLGIALFIVLSGSASAAIRSGIMAFIFLFAAKIGRPGKALNALIFSAAAMIFFNPYILSGDVSFQLSFLATFGVVYILPFLNKLFYKMSEFGGIKEIVLTTLSAQIATLPIIVANFGQFSFLSFIANILILPTVPLVMVGGFLLILLSFVSFNLAQIVSWPIYLVLYYHLYIVNILSNTNLGLIKF